MLFSANVYIRGGDGDGECRRLSRRECYDVSDRRDSGIDSVSVATHRCVSSSESAMNRKHRNK